MPPTLDKKPDKLNKGDVDYDKKFNRPMGPGDTRTQQDYDDEFNKIAEQQNVDDEFNNITANSLSDLENQSANGAPQTTDVSSSEKSPWKTSVNPNTKAKNASLRSRTSRAVFSRRGLAAGGGIAGLIAMMMLVIGIILSPSGILINFKEVGTRWIFNKQVVGGASRNASVLQQKMYGDPSCTNSSRWACRGNNGVNEAFITRLQQQGFRIVGQTAINNDASRFNFTALELVRDGEVVKRIDTNNFISSYHTDPEFRATMDRVNNSLANILRGPAALRVFGNFGIDRRSPVTESSDREQQAKDFREKQTSNSSGGSISTQVGGSDEDTNTQQRDAINDIIGDIDSEDSAQTKSDFVENGTNPETIADTGALNNTTELERVGATAAGTLTGGIKGAAMSWLSGVDNACSLYQVVRVLNFTMKALMVAPLFQYFMMFTVTADRMKAGVASPEEVGAMGDAVTLPSVEPATAGLTFSDSPGFQMITQGVVTDPGNLTRFATGPTAVAAFQTVFNVLNTAGVSANACGAVTSIPGQITMITLGLITCAATLGSGCVAGAIAGAATGAIIAIVAQYAIPHIARSLVGVVTPDPFTDPQRSYAVGNALGAAASVAGDQIGRGNGYPILQEGEYAQLQRDTQAQQRTIAQANGINDREAGAFNTNNPMSVTNQLASALSPHISKSRQGITGLLASSIGVTRQALSGFGTTVRAGSVLDPDSSVADYGGRHCGDPNYIESGFVTTATCGLVRGPNPETLPPATKEGEETHPYGLKNLMNWMQDNDYLVERTESNKDAEPAEMAKGDYKDYIETCIETSEPVTTDGWSLDGSKRVGDQCISSEEKYNKFAAAYQYSSTFSSITKVEENTLGQESGGVQSNDGLIDGDSQELAQAIIDSDNVNGDPRYMSQIEKVAAGDNSCNVSTTILKLIATLMQDYSLFISSLNRQCTGVLTASGEASYHWRDGGGHAVDFSHISKGSTSNPGSATGGREVDIELVKEAANLVPAGSEFGQVNCRPRIELPGMNQVQDSCNHVHIGVPVE